MLSKFRHKSLKKNIYKASKKKQYKNYLTINTFLATNVSVQYGTVLQLSFDQYKRYHP